MKQPDNDPTFGGWVRAVVFVVVGAILVTAVLVWFTFTFIAHPCCTVPTG